MDVNNDGNLDIVSHGNFYETEVETNTQDAGIGNVLLGNGDGTFTALHARFSGFYSPLNAKGLAQINIGKNNTPSIITTNSNNKMQVFSLNYVKTNVVLAANDNYAEITYSDGKIRRQELYTGSGYLSQSTRSIVVTDQVSKVTVYDNSGKSRIVYGEQISLFK